MRRGLLAGVLACGLAAVPAWADDAVAEAEGIRLGFSLRGAEAGTAPLAGHDGLFAFTLSTDAGAAPLRGAHPAAWLIRRGEAPPSDDRTCRATAAGLLANTLLSPPALDLNGFHLLVLSDAPQIAVIDPRNGFGGSRLLGLIDLDASGSDWAISRARDMLAVAEPRADAIALIEAIGWRVTTKSHLPGPDRLVLTPDERLLLASYHGADASGIAILDLSKPDAPPVLLPTGAGRADIATDAASSFAFVTAKQADRVWIVDLDQRRLVADLATGARPVAVGYSALARRAYVAAEDGSVTVLGTDPPAALGRIAGPAGLAALAVAPGGRFVLAASPSAGQVIVVDTATDQIVRTLAVEGRPDAIGFTDRFAYLRRKGDAFLEAIPLGQIGIPGRAPNVLNVGIGQLPLGAFAMSSRAASMAASPDGGDLLIASPGERAVYDYHEGMAAPSGSFASYAGEPRAVALLDRGLRETMPGTYRTTGRLPRAGSYDVVFYLDQPRLVQCFDLRIQADPADGAAGAPPPRLDAMALGAAPQAGGVLPIRFRLVDPASGAPQTGVPDVRVVSFRMPGRDRAQSHARAEADGFYTAELSVPHAGLYYVIVEAPSVALAQTTARIIDVAPAATPGEKR
jgi:hypothetical protein